MNYVPGEKLEEERPKITLISALANYIPFVSCRASRLLWVWDFYWKVGMRNAIHKYAKSLDALPSQAYTRTKINPIVNRKLDAENEKTCRLAKSSIHENNKNECGKKKRKMKKLVAGQVKTPATHRAPPCSTPGPGRREPRGPFSWHCGPVPGSASPLPPRRARAPARCACARLRARARVPPPAAVAGASTRAIAAARPRAEAHPDSGMPPARACTVGLTPCLGAATGAGELELVIKSKGIIVI